MVITDKKITIEYENIDDFVIPLNTLFELTVLYNNVKYEFLINIKKNNDKLIVLGGGFMPQDKVKKFKDKPYYMRWSWEFKESVIYYNDPTRYLNSMFRGGWGIGTEDDYYLENIKNILLKLTSKCNILNENILFYGSSMGGFMSLLLATMVKQSTALADIPQLDVSKDTYWDEFKEICFNNKSEKHILENYGYRLNFIQMMKKENYIPNAIMVLDYSFKYDVKSQYSSFFSEKLNEIPFHKNSNNIKVFIVGKNNGHFHLSQDETMYLIDNIINKKLISSLPSNYDKFIDENQNLLWKYLTARFDIKNFGRFNNKITIVENSDDKSLISTPEWFTNYQGEGTVIHSTKGKLTLKIKCHNDGELFIWLKGIDFRDSSGRIPIYINFTNIYINDEKICEEDTLVTHDKPFVFKKRVKDSEIINLIVSWRPA